MKGKPGGNNQRKPKRQIVDDYVSKHGVLGEAEKPLVYHEKDPYVGGGAPKKKVNRFKTVATHVDGLFARAWAGLKARRPNRTGKPGDRALHKSKPSGIPGSTRTLERSKWDYK